MLASVTAGSLGIYKRKEKNVLDLSTKMSQRMENSSSKNQSDIGKCTQWGEITEIALF